MHIAHCTPYPIWFESERFSFPNEHNQNIRNYMTSASCSINVFKTCFGFIYTFHTVRFVVNVLFFLNSFRALITYKHKYPNVQRVCVCVIFGNHAFRKKFSLNIDRELIRNEQRLFLYVNLLRYMKRAISLLFIIYFIKIYINIYIFLYV